MKFFTRPILLLITLIALSVLAHTAPVHSASQTYLGIWSRDHLSPHIADPLLGPGSIFTIEANATDLPPVIDDFNGGIQAFEITIRYDHEILKATFASFRSPQCPVVEGCLFDLENTFELPRVINNDNGTVRVAAVVLGAGNAIGGSGTVFRIGFEVRGTGHTAIDLMESVSQIIAPEGVGSVVSAPYEAIDGSFDNRPPFAVKVEPAFAAVGLEHSISVDVDVYLVGNEGSFNDAVSLTASGQPSGTTITFSPPSGVANFTSLVTVATSPTTPRGTYDIIITGTGGGFTSSTNFTLAVDVRDIAVLDVRASPTFVTVGEPVTITATVTNQGFTTEIFVVRALVDFYLPCDTTLPAQTLQLAPGQTATASFVWNTAGITCRTVSTYVTAPVPGDVDTADNSRTGPTVTLNRRPIAAFSITPGSPVVGQPVQFDASQSSDPDGEISTYIWFFGDGYTATEKAVSHAYNSTGTYDVTLEVTDGDGDVSTTTRQVVVAAGPQPPGPQSPTAPLQLPPVILYSAAGALGAVAVAVLLVLRRTRKQPE